MPTKPQKSVVAAALQHCAAEAVHIPAQIQPHGGLIGVDNQTLEITYASENIRSFLRASYDNLLGKPLGSVFGRKTRHDLVNGMMLGGTGQKTSDLGLIDFAGTPFLVGCAASDTTTIFEIEATKSGEDRSFKSLKDLELLLAQVRAAQDRQSLFETSVHLLQVLTGYDRVMVYEFDSEGNGTVVAETASIGLRPYLGLSFPAWDIPQQARRMMQALPLRYIADVKATGSPVHAARTRLPELDMTYAHLRGVSPVHLEYLHNMEVGATFTLNAVVEGRLWGMIALHHSTTRYPGQRVRQLCRNFISYFSQHLCNFHKSDQIDNLHKADALRRRLIDNASTAGQSEAFEVALLSELCSALDADGAVLIRDKTLVTAGSVPSGDVLHCITSEVSFSEDISTSSNIARDYPALHKRLGTKFAGLLVARRTSDLSFVFLRHAKDMTVRWAGAPDKTVHLQNGVARLNPRASFSEYRQKVKNTSRPWTTDQCRIAQELWSIFITSERAALLKQTDLQRTDMIDELNHRVRNMLALIRTLSRQTVPYNGSIENYVSALDARIAAVTAAHDMGADKTKRIATVAKILQREARPHNQLNDRVQIKGPDAGIRPDLAPVLALVMHELMTNATRHGALSVPDGHVEVHLEKLPDGMSIRWQELNGPEAVPPETKGFGITLIETSLPFELGGSVDVVYGIQGISVTISVPSDALVGSVPVRAAQTNQPVKPEPDAAKKLADFSGETCLLVEDNYLVSLDTARVLKAVGYERVETAQNVSEAFAKLDRFTPTIAVLDINLSQGRTSEPVALELIARGTPFVFVSGYGDTTQLDKSFAKSPVLKKPLDESELREMLGKLRR
jgi:light-regulated signal transduction histidine kinase (bacteriophytochrome)/CheY-like chemotaxis protein